MGGPSYSPDFGLVIGGSALFTFRMDKSDLELLRSVVPLVIAFMTKGGVKVVCKPQLFFAHDRFRIFGQFQYENFPDNFYGVGYVTNRDYVRGASTSLFRESELQINPLFLFSIRETDWFAGPYLDLSWERMSDVGEDMAVQEDYVTAGGDASGYQTMSLGLGFTVTLDSRDVPANAYRGVYFDFRAAAYNDFMGRNGAFSPFGRIDMDYRQYHFSEEEMESVILDIYTKMYDKYESDKKLIPHGNLFEMRFEDFEADPVGMAGKIYSSLGLSGFEEARPAMEKYAGQNSKNVYHYQDHTVRLVEEHWGYALKQWDYDLA